VCTASKARDLHIVLEASVSRRGQQDALRQGVRPTDRIVHRVDPGHPLWQRVVALEPEIHGSYVGVPLNRSWEVSIVNEKYAIEDLTSEPVFGWAVWRYPDATIEWGEPQPLDEWLTIDRLIELEEKNRAAAHRALTEMQHELDEDVRPSWGEWMSGFIEECRKRHNEWMGQKGLSGPAKLSRQQTLAGFRDAFEAFDANTNDAPERTGELYALFFEADKHMDAVARSIEVAKRRKELVAEATSWAHEHGSQRLRKALAAELMDSSLGVYRDERLAFEHPEWGWLDHDMVSDLKSINNPSELALDALLEAREWDPSAQLKWLNTQQGGVAIVVASFLDRRIHLGGQLPPPPVP
jgi:hypothetical protein